MTSSTLLCLTAARRAARSLHRTSHPVVSSTSSSPSSFSLFDTATKGFTRVITSTIFPTTSQKFSFSSVAVYPESSNEHNAHDSQQRRMPVTQFTQDEEMVRDAARHWANEVLRPLVRDMDNEGKTRPEVIQGLFDHGFMGMVSCILNLSIISSHFFFNTHQYVI
jgi:hypothetical protein